MEALQYNSMQNVAPLISSKCYVRGKINIKFDIIQSMTYVMIYDMSWYDLWYSLYDNHLWRKYPNILTKRLNSVNSLKYLEAYITSAMQQSNLISILLFTSYVILGGYDT